MFNRQCRSDQHSEKVRELLGTQTKTYNFSFKQLIINFAEVFCFVIPDAKRWNSWFHGISHVKKLPRVKTEGKILKSVCEALKAKPLNSTDYQFIWEYVEVMKPIAIGLDLLQGENSVSSGNVLHQSFSFETF